MKLPLVLFVMSTFLHSCGADGLTEATQDSLQYENASLVIESPMSGEIYVVGAPLPLHGKIVDPTGTTLAFVDLIWESDLMENPIALGTKQDVYLDIGVHTISATAALPNGDRLKETLGGIRIQSPLTGIYTGNVRLDVTDFDNLTDMLRGNNGWGGNNENEDENPSEEEGDVPNFDGIDLDNLTASCVGGFDFVVDLWGRVLNGGGECSIHLLVTDPFDLSYTIKGNMVQNSANGDIEISLGFLPVAFDWEGTFHNNRLQGDLEGETFLFKLQGSLEARRITPYIDIH